DTIAESVSWYGRLFSVVEKSAVEAAGSYVTDNCSYLFASTSYLLKKTDIIENYNAKGMYNTERLNKESYPTSKYAKVNGTGVQETTSGDKLFVLDYYDMNNKSYGFVDSDGQTYAEKVAAFTGKSWNTTSNWYPAYLDGANINGNSIFCDYLKFSDEVSDHYWIRSAGHIYSSTKAIALMMYTEGSVDCGNTSDSYGVRPAFNMDTTKIAYATTVKPASGWTDMSQTATKPEYKTYLKDTDYTANTTNAKALVGVKDGTLNIRYNNPTGKSGGKLILLLSDKNKNDGSVAYQTAIAMNSKSATDNVFTTVTLPGSINYSDYKLTLMYASDNASDANASETIYCSYATDSGIVAPSDINVTYANASKWIADLKGDDKPAWLDLNIYNNTAFMSVKSVEYTNAKGEKQTDKTYTTADIKNAGTYKVTMTLVSGLKWSDGKTEDKSFTIKIAQAESSIEAQYANAPTYVPDELPAISLKAGGTPGKIAWDDEQVPKSGTKDYTWKFTPTDTNNYTEETGSKSFTFAARVVDTVTIKSFNTNGATVYTNTPDTELKSYLTVEIKYVSFDETITLDPGDYELQINSNNKLKAGDNKLKVKYTTSDNKVKYSAEFPISGVVELSYKT
ncbi:MAG: hypothetical protein K2J61_03450, partial [Clostridia bacterium]|nr:hypothetical protein [Clostridia bacterium]